MNKPFTYVSLDNSEAGGRLLINHPKVSAVVSLLGGQVLSFSPKGKENLLWLSGAADLSGTGPIRGGAPVCWPWFGVSKDQDKPKHGCVRNTRWQVTNIKEGDKGVIVELAAPAAALAEQGVDALLKVRYSFSEELDIALITYNLHRSVFEFSQAIHTYLSVDDISAVKIEGLGGAKYLDTLNGEEAIQAGSVTIQGEIDRIYHTTDPVAVVRDGHKVIEIRSTGQDSIVVWNPGADKAKALVDFDDDGYQKMICVETANTVPRVMLPQSTTVLSQRIGRLPG